jgi:chromosomal replication initiator protein
VATYVEDHYPNYQVRYVSSETFMNRFVEAIRNKTLPEFKQHYRNIDVLLVDDIQFMEGKEGLQEEFFHTFNSIQQAGGQIVLTSDRSPDSIPTLEDRLRSRFKMGLVTHIQPPDIETRLAILHKKATFTAGNSPGSRRGAPLHRREHHDQHPRTRRSPDTCCSILQPQRRSMYT